MAKPNLGGQEPTSCSARLVVEHEPRILIPRREGEQGKGRPSALAGGRQLTIGALFDFLFRVQDLNERFPAGAAARSGRAGQPNFVEARGALPCQRPNGAVRHALTEANDHRLPPPVASARFMRIILELMKLNFNFIFN